MLGKVHSKSPQPEFSSRERREKDGTIGFSTGEAKSRRTLRASEPVSMDVKDVSPQIFHQMKQV
jgi:hypothetical protein